MFCSGCESDGCSSLHHAHTSKAGCMSCNMNADPVLCHTRSFLFILYLIVRLHKHKWLRYSLKYHFPAPSHHENFMLHYRLQALMENLLQFSGRKSWHRLRNLARSCHCYHDDPIWAPGLTVKYICKEFQQFCPL